MRKIVFGVGLIWLVLQALAQAADVRVFREGRFEQGELRYIEGLQVLTVQGTPGDIGRQRAALTGEAARTIANYPKDLLRRWNLESKWPRIVEAARGVLEQSPPPHREELLTFADTAGVDRDLAIVGNTLMDIYGGTFACSSLIVEPARSATKGPLFGRNLDYYTLGFLDKYGLVTVYRPQGKHAFVSIGFPGLLGCLSGMNDAGLALAVHEAHVSADGAAMFNPKGMPYTFCFRRMLEECTTVEQAEKLLRSTPRTTLLSLAVCDRRGGLVLEMTPKTVMARRAGDGLLACTNQFRTQPLSVWPWCRRYNTLLQAAAGPIDVAEMARRLDQVNLGRLTLQTMIFEPSTLTLHLAMGSCPSSSQPLRRLPLAGLLARDK
jgi:isopenicillin-N N-acyltransferase like protein